MCFEKWRLTDIFLFVYIHDMECTVLFTDEFEEWWNGLGIEEQESVTHSVICRRRTAST